MSDVRRVNDSLLKGILLPKWMCNASCMWVDVWRTVHFQYDSHNTTFLLGDQRAILLLMAFSMTDELSALYLKQLIHANLSFLSRFFMFWSNFIADTNENGGTKQEGWPAEQLDTKSTHRRMSYEHFIQVGSTWCRRRTSNITTIWVSWLNCFHASTFDIIRMM